jgi:serine/threonine protein kinase
MSLANLVGHVLDGKYRIERQLGKGGMGAVYLATHLGTDRPVAIKVIMPQYTRNDEFVERFRREAKAAGRMRHPNVVDVTDFGFAGVDGQQVAYLVMEYLDGCTLADILAEENQLPVDWVVDILEQVCSAVDEAHQAGIIHRDLKPENIWLEPNRRGGYTVKVLDFGLAKQGDPIRPMNDATNSNPTALSSAPVGATIAAPARDTNVIEPLSSTISPNRAATQAITPDAAATQALPLNEEAATYIIAPDADAAVTHLLPPDADESATLIQHVGDEAEIPYPSDATDDESATRIMLDASARTVSLSDDDQSATRILPADGDNATSAASPFTARRVTDASGARPTADEPQGGSTASAGGITRIGAILGTPLYMSPEQCRGEALDARSDIYSLGIIAYQMLAGSAPFTGDINDVLRGHMEATPPPLRERRKKIPKRMAQVIMRALAKRPEDRPDSALSFANALRASSEGIGKMFRRALAIYSEHFPVFFRLSLIAYLPVVVTSALLLSYDLVQRLGMLPKAAIITIGVGLALVQFISQLIAASVTTGVIIWLVVQLAVAPLRPLKVRHALRTLKKRIKRLTMTSLRVIVVSFLGLCLLVIPGVIYFINATLASPVVIMENLRGRAAVRRSKQLVKRARPTVIAIVAIHFFLPLVISALLSSAFGFRHQPPKEGTTITVRVGELLSTTISIFISPLLATLTALLYLKVRQLGGERFNQMLDQFEDEVPKTRWQQRMRERLNSSSATRSA